MSASRWEGPAPEGMQHFMGTEQANGEPSETVELRRTRCFELATYAMLFGLAGRTVGAELVHGTWHGPGAPRRIPHAWVNLIDPVTGDRATWEPIHAVVYDRSEFYAWTAAWDERTYNVVTARACCVGAAGGAHYGPWHMSRYSPANPDGPNFGLDKQKEEAS